ncbi:hypothetical protein P8845_06370 [Bacillus spizizenii]|nr:hypothetical protein [Bacillus spizizenii]MCY7886736.1 hypothetical protein [Bacillus spizizenii]MCY8125664.1 hypothetical protein [Bacillus spizizenii]MCY8166586.1 hypothetical protein [Bacillus spizizenii]MCY8189739.1 hypothetical protein [Bacillus spizizenii]
MKRFLELIVNEIKRNYFILKNYKFAFLTNIISNLIFIAIFLSIVTAIFNLSQGFMMILWPIMMALIGAGGDNIKGDMQIGTLERIISKNKDFKNLLLARILADGIWTVPVVLIVCIIFSILSPNKALIFLQLIMVLLPLVVGSLGIGLYISGLTIYHKDIGSIVNIVTIILMINTVLPWYNWLQNFTYIVGAIIPFLSLNIFVQSNQLSFFILACFNSLLIYVVGSILFNSYFNRTKRDKGFIRY